MAATAHAQSEMCHLHQATIQPHDSRPLEVVPWHTQSVETILAQFNVDVKTGLADGEAAARLARFGTNELGHDEGTTVASLLFAQLKSILVWLLVIAAIVSGMLGEWIDCVAIAAIVVLNALIGAYQDYSAERSIAALRKLSAPAAKVRRGGRLVVAPAATVVPGDLLVLEAGDLVAADARLIEAATLSCVEKALTGESEAVAKGIHIDANPAKPLAERTNMVFMGTAVATGTGAAIVVATGRRSEVGAIADLMQSAEDVKTPLQLRLARVGKFLVYIAIAIVGIMFVVGVLRGDDLLAISLTAVSLAVAAVPEGLPAIVTVALALGVNRMAKRRALIRRLPAVETLGSTGVICTDKTGTLTVGQMTVRELWMRSEAERDLSFSVTGEGYAPEGCLLRNGSAVPGSEGRVLQTLVQNLAGCNNAETMLRDGVWDAVGDPTEAAMLVAAKKIGLDRSAFESRFPRLAEIPFDSDRKRSSTVHRAANGTEESGFALVNGAPEALLHLCESIVDGSTGTVRRMTASDLAAVQYANQAMASRALRVLACARRDGSWLDSLELTAASLEMNLTFVGLVGIQDPPRTEARAAIAQCKDAGIRVVMITGDQGQTASAIARNLDLVAESDNQSVMSGAELQTLTDESFTERVRQIVVYARVTAADKLRIIRAWRGMGEVVAMTGDGVNDAPALRGADVGVAMGRSGTEVAKQASDIIVTDDNFASIVAAIEEGRGVFDNIRKTIVFLLGGNAAELLVIGVCLAAGLPIPFLPIQILWINLVTDGLPALCLAADPVGADVMKRRPRPRNASILDLAAFKIIAVTSIATCATTLGVYLYALEHYDLTTARTMAFATLVFAELLRSFGCRSDTTPIWRMNWRSNIALALAVGASFMLQVWSHHNEFLSRLFGASMLSWRTCMTLMILGAVPLLILEFGKVLKRTARDTVRKGDGHG
jgi:Ca2+-transporting ATPase